MCVCFWLLLQSVDAVLTPFFENADLRDSIPSVCLLPLLHFATLFTSDVVVCPVLPRHTPDVFEGNVIGNQGSLLRGFWGFHLGDHDAHVCVDPARTASIDDEASIFSRQDRGKCVDARLREGVGSASPYEA